MNKNFRKILALALVLATGTTLMAGCSKSTSTNSGTSSSKVKLELFSTKSENKTILQSLINDFQVQNPNIQITLNAPPNAGTVIKTRLAKNDMPDLYAVGGDVNYAALVDANALVDMTNDSLTQNIQKPYLDQLLGLSQNDDGKYYGIPYATNADGVLYNKDIFKQLNLTVPKTWDEFVTVMNKVKAAGKFPFYLTLKDSWTGMCFFNVLASDLEPDNFLKDRKDGKTTFATTHSEVVDKMATIAQNAQSDILGVGYNDGNVAFAQGKSAMYFQGNWAISEIKKANPNINLGLFPLPASNDVSKNKIVSGIDVLFAISSKSQHQAEAKKFIEFILQKENAQKYINDQFAFSAVKDVVQQDPSVSDLKDVFSQGQIGVYPDHYYPSALDVGSLIQGYFTKKDKTAFLQQLDTQYDKANSR